MPDSRKPTAADHAWAEQQARQIEAAMPEAAVEKPLRDLESAAQILENGYPLKEGMGPLELRAQRVREAAAFLKETQDDFDKLEAECVKLLEEKADLRAALSRAEAERDLFMSVCQQIADKYDDERLSHQDFRVGAFAVAVAAFDAYEAEISRSSQMEKP